ncbi:MAG: hypothetical protein SGI88_04700 [Candidatus Hydrogenedentes bacterium]|nr:hypothetical protein [Candidatus Hydrogenedentota bacterium]
MIPLELKWALLLYTGVIAVIALVIWVYTELTVRRPHRYLGQQFLWRCTFCGYTYLDESSSELSKCPRCESLVASTDANARLAPATPPGQIESAEDAGKNTSRRKRPHQRRRGPRRR